MGYQHHHLHQPLSRSSHQWSVLVRNPGALKQILGLDIMATSRANPEADGARNICKGCGYPGAYPSDLKNALASIRYEICTRQACDASAGEQGLQGILSSVAPWQCGSEASTTEPFNSCLISPARLHALRVVPEHVAEDRLFEILRDGLVGRPLRDCCDWVGGLPFVNAWVEGHACDTMATLRFFVLEAISVRTVAMGGSLSENTLAIGIGEDVQRIDDAKCLTHL